MLIYFKSVSTRNVLNRNMKTLNFVNYLKINFSSSFRVIKLAL